ncbi:MAG: hypothetical protein EHM93_15550 [Bacteroidales bacterium]|nr:MAG: hypothetical protein EHM93_15550 [Bacteroidales bacterium]
MDKSISLSFCFRKENKAVVSFTDPFFQDLSKCFSRFKVSTTLSDKPELDSDGYVFIFLSKQDLDDNQFVNSILPFAESPNTLLINLDQIKFVDKGFPIHKFKIFRFWDEIKETAELRLFRRGVAENNALYWEKITDITIEIVEKYSKATEKRKGKIFLAQTDNAQSADRDNLRRDLVEMGYEVIPNKLFSLDYNECNQQVEQQLKDCSLIIHPIPLVYSKYFAEKGISIVEQQCVLSSKYAAEKQHEVTRIIWIPSDFDITDEENQIFVEKIQRDQDQAKNTLVLKVTLEELKKIYRKLLSGEYKHQVENNLPDVYVVADNDDEKRSESIIRSAQNPEMAVKTNFRGITYHQHLNYLANSKVVVINYTSENEPWLTMKVNDIYKSKGMGESKPFTKIILVKESKDLDTAAFEGRFSEVHVCSIEDLKLNVALRNN